MVLRGFAPTHTLLVSAVEHPGLLAQARQRTAHWPNVRIVEADAFDRIEKLLTGKVANGGPQKLAKGTKIDKAYLASVEKFHWFDIRPADEEVASLFEWAAYGRVGGRLSRVERWLHLAYYTGRRKAAIEGLTWDRVDFALNRIDFDEPGRKRTKKRRGVAYLNEKLRALLERAKREAGDDAVYVLDHPGSIRKAFGSLCKRAGLGDVTPHTLKHTCATHMLRRGVSIWDVAGALETTPATIQRVYGKHVPEAARKAMEALL